MDFALPPASPKQVIGLRDSSFAADLFITAVAAFDVFNRLAVKPLDLAGVCKALGIKSRPADVMLTLFKSYGFLREKRGEFCLTDAARAYLTSGSDYDLTSYVNSLKDRPVCAAIAGVLRTGQPANWAAAKQGREWADSMADDAFAASFTAGMNSRGAYLAGGVVKAVDLAGHRRLLDIGGASGIYAAALVNAFPRLRAAVFEKPPVDAVARYSLKKLGFEGKIGVAAGDVFQDALPAGYDVHFLSHVLHDWDIPEVKIILKNSFENLESGGIIVIHDAHVNKAKTGPRSVAEYSVLLMVLSRGKCYSLGEMSGLLAEAGFTGMTHRPTILNRSIVTARKPA